MAVAFDAVGPGATGSTVSGTGMPLSLSWSHTCSGSSLAMIVVVVLGTAGASNDAATSASVTYGGTAMTSLGLVHSNNQSNGYVQMFGLAVATAGTATVALTVSGSGATGSNTLVAGSTSFTGVDPASPFNNTTTAFGNGNTASVTIANASGGMVVDGVAYGSAINSDVLTQRWLNNYSQSSAAGNAASSTSATSGSVTTGYSLAGTSLDWWGTIATSLRAYVPPAPPVPVAWLSA